MADQLSIRRITLDGGVTIEYDGAHMVVTDNADTPIKFDVTPDDERALSWLIGGRKPRARKADKGAGKVAPKVTEPSAGAVPAAVGASDK